MLRVLLGLIQLALGFFFAFAAAFVAKGVHAEGSPLPAIPISVIGIAGIATSYFWVRDFEPLRRRVRIIAAFFLLMFALPVLTATTVIVSGIQPSDSKEELAFDLITGTISLTALIFLLWKTSRDPEDRLLHDSR